MSSRTSGVAVAVSSASGIGVHRLDSSPKCEVIRSKIVSPLRDAVCLINHEQ